jgi:hypothetical protein
MPGSIFQPASIVFLEDFVWRLLIVSGKDFGDLQRDWPKMDTALIPPRLATSPNADERLH